MIDSRRLGVLLCGHGSRDDDARIEFERFVEATRNGLAANRLSASVEGAYLEFLHPSLTEGFQRLVHANVGRIVAQPLMLFAARHATNDIPDQISRLATRNPRLAVICGQELAPNEALLVAATDRIEATLRDIKSRAEEADTILLVIGRGSSDAHANGILANVADCLKRRLGIARAEWAFAGIARPTVEEGLRQAAHAGFRQVVVFPYFLFTGTLVKRIHRIAADIAQTFPSVAFSVTRHLADHPAVVDTVVARVAGMAPIDS